MAYNNYILTAGSNAGGGGFPELTFNERVGANAILFTQNNTNTYHVIDIIDVSESTIIYTTEYQADGVNGGLQTVSMPRLGLAKNKAYKIDISSYTNSSKTQATAGVKEATISSVTIAGITMDASNSNYSVGFIAELDNVKPEKLKLFRSTDSNKPEKLKTKTPSFDFSAKDLDDDVISTDVKTVNLILSERDGTLVYNQEYSPKACRIHSIIGSEGDFVSAVGGVGVGWFASTTSFANVDNRIQSFIASGQYGSVGKSNIPVLLGDSIYIRSHVKSSGLARLVRFGDGGTAVSVHTGGGEYEPLSILHTSTSTGNMNIRIDDSRPSGWDQIDFTQVIVMNLTQMVSDGLLPSVPSKGELDEWDYDVLKQLVSNGDFSDGSAEWTLGSGHAVSGGKLISTNASSDVSSNASVNIGNSYSVVSELSSYESGSMSISSSGFGDSNIQLSAAEGFETNEVIAADASPFVLSASAFNGSYESFMVLDKTQWKGKGQEPAESEMLALAKQGYFDGFRSSTQPTTELLPFLELEVKIRAKDDYEYSEFSDPAYVNSIEFYDLTTDANINASEGDVIPVTSKTTIVNTAVNMDLYDVDEQNQAIIFYQQFGTEAARADDITVNMYSSFLDVFSKWGD